MKLDSFYGNPQIKTILKNPTHAYIICGNKGSGRHTLTGIMAKAFVCGGDGEKPCGKCRGCKKADDKNHPDIIPISSDINIKSLRAVLADMSYTPNEADNRCYVVDDADKLSVACQNVLLKSIEEPPPYVKFIFICQNRHALLETVRSRCVALETFPVGTDLVLEYLSDPRFSSFSAEEKQRAAAMCEGYIGAAVEYLEKGQTEVYALCERFASALIKRDTQTLLSITSFKTRNDFVLFSENLLAYFRLHLRSHKKPEEWQNRAVCALGEKRLCALCEKLSALTQNVGYNINLTLWSVYLVKECMSACWQYVKL